MIAWHTPAVFAVMREIGADAERRLQNSRGLTPRGGMVAVGGAHMDDFFSGNALSEFLRALRSGVLPDDAAVIAKTAGQDSVHTWNKSRGNDYTVHRWEHTADEAVDSAAARIKRVMPRVSFGVLECVA